MDKLYVSADIEGVCGIVDWEETEIASAQGAYFRAQMSRETAAVCEAAVAKGVRDILVKDAHGSGRSIDPAALPDSVRLMRAWTRDPLSMMAGLDASFGGAAYIGYHSGATSDGNPLSHTMDLDAVWLRINGQDSSEFRINAYTAAAFGVPSIFLSGDARLCAEAQTIAPGIRTVAVSEGLGNASVSINPRLALERIREGMAMALDEAASIAAPLLPPSFTIAIRFRQHFRAYRASFYPGCVRPGAHEVEYSCERWTDALAFMHFVL